MAAAIKEALDVDEVELISGDRGEFSIWVGADCVARKSAQGYPDQASILAAVSRALG